MSQTRKQMEKRLEIVEGIIKEYTDQNLSYDIALLDEYNELIILLGLDKPSGYGKIVRNKVKSIK